MSHHCPSRQRDGIDGLRKREVTRLWFRMGDEGEGAENTVTPGSAVRVIEADSDSLHGTDTLVREIVQPSRNLIELKELFEQTAEEDVVEGVVAEVKPLTDWRDTPSTCPVLLLSATAILDARNPGPILGPGTQYRLLNICDGIVSLQVATIDGQIAYGYCHATDFSCIDPHFASCRRDRQTTGRLGTARLEINKISSRISGATTSFMA
jgi:hypothetical protein